MASYKVCVVIALACAIAACSAEEGKRAERFAFGGLGGFGLAGAALPVATSYSLPVAKTILPIAPAVTSYAAPAIAAPIVSHAVAPVVSTYAAAAPVVSTYAAAPVVSSYAAPVVAHAPVVSSFGYSGVAAGYSAGFGYGAYGHGLLKK